MCNDRNTSCGQRISGQLQGRIAELRKLWNAYTSGDERQDGETIYEYGLCFDYVEPDTFNDQREGYFRYQLSCGRPSRSLTCRAFKLTALAIA